MVVENTNFWKKGNLSSEKTIVAYFFSYYRVSQGSRHSFQGSKRFFDVYSGTYKSIFSGSKWLLKAQIFEKRQYLQWKIYCGPFFSYYRESQTLRDGLWGCKRYSDNYSRSYLIISVSPEKLLKTQNFEKKRQTFLWKKRIDQFSRIFEYDKPHGTIFKGPQAILTNTVEPIREFF